MRLADQVDLRDRVASVEDLMKQFLTTIQQLTSEVKALRVNPVPALVYVEATAAKHKSGKKTIKEVDDRMPDLEDDLVQVIVEKNKPDDMPKMKHDKRFAKLEEKVR